MDPTHTKRESNKIEVWVRCSPSPLQQIQTHVCRRRNVGPTLLCWSIIDKMK